MLESMKFMYEALTEESTESPKREIMAIERSSGTDPCHRESLESSLGRVNEEDLLSQTKDLDDAQSQTWRPAREL